MSCEGPDLRYLIPERKMRTKINDISLSGHLKLLLSGVQCIIDVEWPSHVNRSYYWPLPCAEWPCSFFCSNSKPTSLCLVLVSDLATQRYIPLSPWQEIGQWLPFRTRLTVGHLADRTNDNFASDSFWWRIIFHCRDIGTARKYIKLPLAMISKLKHLNNCLIVSFSSVSLCWRITLKTKNWKKEKILIDFVCLWSCMIETMPLRRVDGPVSFRVCLKLPQRVPSENEVQISFIFLPWFPGLSGLTSNLVSNQCLQKEDKLITQTNKQ